MLWLPAAPAAPASASALASAQEGIGPPPEGAPYFGYNEDWVTERGRLDMARHSGADTLRVNVPWSQIEPAKGQFSWASWDHLYLQVLSAGMRPILVLTDAPCWAFATTPGRCGAHQENARPPLMRHLDSWARFARLVAERYRFARGIEVWNEPNFKDYWRSRGPNPVQYGRLLASASRGIKRANREVPVVAAGMLTAVGRGNGRPFLGFMRRALEVAGGAHYDAVAIHPYPFSTENPIGAVYEDVEATRALLAELGREGTPIWVTEVGISTAGPQAYSPGGQAFVLEAIYDLLDQAPDVPVIIVHRFVDDVWRNGSREPGYGIVTEAGLPKPVYCVFARKRNVANDLC